MRRDVSKYEDMSPFEVKNDLIETAEKSSKKKNIEMLNAGRGNPNFLNTTVRSSFNLFSDFAVEIAERFKKFDDIGYRPRKEELYKRFVEFVEKNKDRKGSQLLADSINWAIDHFAKDKEDDFMFEMTDAVLGDFYPMPPRIFPYVEKIVKAYVKKALCLDLDDLDKYDLFATEGATAAMVYIFNSLKINRILKKGDQVAIMTPIFSPYLEIPVLEEFHFVEVLIEGKENMDWQIPAKEIEKLKDPKIKALYIVNPTNPTSISLNNKCIKKIAELIRTQRNDLIILTDVVYAPFVTDFNSLLDEIPKNTICVYSYSKYFGVTGWRLGVVMLHHDNIIDEMISKLPQVEKHILHERYKTLVPDVENFKFIDRLESDSRKEALAHTGGLSCPQQCIMALFSLFGLIDTKNKYKNDIHQILKKRIEHLYGNLEEEIPPEKDHTYYYALIDIADLSQRKYGEEFANYLRSKVNPLEFLFDLAENKCVICLPGSGFAGPKWSLRVSLANLKTEEYPGIGLAIKEQLQEYFDDWKSKQ
jgi:aspartate 4-decarboxylase